MLTMRVARYGRISSRGARCTGGAYGSGMFWQAARNTEAIGNAARLTYATIATCSNLGMNQPRPRGRGKVSVTTAKPALLRQLGLISATALVVSNMVGTGIFTSTGFLTGDLGAPSLLMWIWNVGAVCALLGAICYSELGINFPSSGGEYVYLTQAFGPTWGFMTGWASFFAGFAGPIALAALAFSDYLGYFFPILKQENAHVILGSGHWTLRFGGAQMAACGLVAVFTLLNVFGVQRVARVQNVLTGAKVAVLAVFIVMGFLIGKGDSVHFSMN